MDNDDLMRSVINFTRVTEPTLCSCAMPNDWGLPKGEWGISKSTIISPDEYSQSLNELTELVKSTNIKIDDYEGFIRELTELSRKYGIWIRSEDPDSLLNIISGDTSGKVDLIIYPEQDSDSYQIDTNPETDYYKQKLIELGVTNKDKQK